MWFGPTPALFGSSRAHTIATLARTDQGGPTCVPERRNAKHRSIVMSTDQAEPLERSRCLPQHIRITVYVVRGCFRLVSGVWSPFRAPFDQHQRRFWERQTLFHLRPLCWGAFCVGLGPVWMCLPNTSKPGLLDCGGFFLLACCRWLPLATSPLGGGGGLWFTTASFNKMQLATQTSRNLRRREDLPKGGPFSVCGLLPARGLQFRDSNLFCLAHALGPEMLGPRAEYLPCGCLLLLSKHAPTAGP